MPIFAFIAASVAGSLLSDPITAYIKDRFLSAQNGVTTISVYGGSKSISPVAYLVVGLAAGYVVMKAVKK